MGLGFAAPKTESGENRRVELDRNTAGVLLGWQVAEAAERAAWGPAHADHSRVFCQEVGTPLHPERVDRLLHGLTDKVMVPRDRERPDSPLVSLRRVRFHDLRHGQASMMLAAGVDMNVVSKRLGHSRSSFTADVYNHLVEEVCRDAAERAAGLLQRRSTVPTT